MSNISIQTDYKKVYTNKEQSRWIYIDEYGTKNTITLKTVSGKLITRTCQYWATYFIGETLCKVDKAKISYNGKYMYVNKDTILED